MIQANTGDVRDRKESGIAYFKPTISKNDIKSVLESFVSDEISFGQTARTYEKEFGETFEFSYALSTTSLNSAYHLSLLSLDIKTGNEVILASNAPLSALDAIYQTGAEPVLVDIQKNSFHPSQESIIHKITENTRAVVLSYPYGSFYDYQDLKKAIAGLGRSSKEKIYIFEDISYIIGSEFNGSYVGTDADVTIAGLHEDMLMTIGKGAMVMTANKNLYAILKDRRMHGSNKVYRPRFDYGIADYQAAMGLEQLGHLNAVIERKRKIGEKYIEVVMQNNGLETCFKSARVDTYGAFPIIAQKPVEHIQKYFNSLQIETSRTIPFGPLHDMIGLNVLDYPNTARLFERGLLLPIYPGLSRTNIERIMASIKGYY
ncbi:MAG: DegT/DnrJ/EryC1/StrS aminotransferase family protein [Spirochaetia bacterium]|nr:DegT/DnrJ/EryC1/StrS aminotransferase family protein [Spirochaetia bacterium]